MDLSKLTMGEKVVGAAGVLLLIDLLFLPWHKIEFGGALLNVSVTRSAIESPNGLWGVLALLVTLAMVAVVVVTRFTTAKVPDLPIPLGQAMFFAGIAVIALLFLKLLLETSALGFGAWLGVLLGAAMAYGGFLIRQEAGAAPSSPPMGSPG